MIEAELLDLLRCPQGGGKLIISPDEKELWCQMSLKSYPIEDNVPILRIDKSRDLQESDF